MTPQDIVNDFNAVNKTDAVVKLIPRDVYGKQKTPGAHEFAEMVPTLIVASLESFA